MSKKRTIASHPWDFDFSQFGIHACAFKDLTRQILESFEISTGKVIRDYVVAPKQECQVRVGDIVEITGTFYNRPCFKGKIAKVIALVSCTGIYGPGLQFREEDLPELRANGITCHYLGGLLPDCSGYWGNPDDISRLRVLYRD